MNGPGDQKRPFHLAARCAIQPAIVQPVLLRRILCLDLKLALTRKEINLALCRNVGLSGPEAASVLDSVLEVITSGLDSDGQVKLSSFGVFTVLDKAERQARNPRLYGLCGQLISCGCGMGTFENKNSLNLHPNRLLRSP